MRTSDKIGLISAAIILAIITAFVVFAPRHPLECNPLKTDIIGMDIDTVKKVCGEPWSEYYKGGGNDKTRLMVEITLHYTGGDIYLIGYGSNLVGTKVTGWFLP